MDRRLGSITRTSATEQAVDKICTQWAAVSLMLFGKEQGRDPQGFGQRLQEILKASEPTTLRQELQTLLKSYNEMKVDDLKSYVSSMENLIRSLLSHKTMQTIVETCIISGYEALELFCFDKDSTRAWFKQRTVTDPEILVPDEYFPHLERQLQFVYEIMSGLESIECSSFSTHVFRILMDYILQGPQSGLKRFEGRILSLLSQVPRFATAILKKLDIFVDGLKQNPEYRKPLIMACQNIRRMRLSAQPETVEGMEPRIKRALKMKPGPIQDAFLPFLVETCQAMNVPQDMRGEYLSKLCVDVFKFLSAKQKEKMWDNRAMRLAIVGVGLANEKNFAGYWDKMAGYFVKFAQTQPPTVVMKLARLLGELYCPEKFSVQDFSRFSYELMFEKSRIPILRRDYQDLIEPMCEFWVQIAKKGVAPVVDILKSIAQVIPSLRDYPASIHFLVRTVAQLKATMSDDCIEQLVVSLEPHLEILLNVSSPTEVITNTLTLLPMIWKSVQRSHMTLPSILQALSGHAEFSVVETCIVNYLDMMKTLPHNELPLNIGFSILFNLLIKIHNKTPYATVDKLFDILDGFLATLISVIKKTDGGGYADDWKALVSTVEKTVFPFLFSNIAIIKVKVYRIMETIRTYADFPCLVQLQTEFNVEDIEGLKLAYAKESNVFSSMFEYVAKFWNETDKKQRPELAQSLLIPLMFIARPGKGRSDPCSGFFRGVIDYLLDMNRECINLAIHQLYPSSWTTFMREYQVSFKKKSGQPAAGFSMILYGFMTHESLSSAKDSLDLFTEYIDLFATLLGSDAKKEVSVANHVLADACRFYLKADETRVQPFVEKVGSVEKLVDNVTTHLSSDIESTQTDYAVSILELLHAVLEKVEITSQFMTTILQKMVKIIEKSFPIEIQKKIAEIAVFVLGTNPSDRQTAFSTVFQGPPAPVCLLLLRILQNGCVFTKPEVLSILSQARSVCNRQETHALYAFVTLLASRQLGTEKSLENPLVIFDPLIEKSLTEFIKSATSPDEFQEYAESITPQADENILSDEAVTRFKELDVDHIDELVITTRTINVKCLWHLLPKLFTVWSTVLDKFSKEMNVILKHIWNYEESPFLIALLARSLFECNPEETVAFFIDKLQIPNKSSRFGDTLRQNITDRGYNRIAAALAMIFSQADPESVHKHFRAHEGFLFLFATFLHGKEGYDTHIYPHLFDAFIRVCVQTNDLTDYNTTSLSTAMMVRIFNSIKSQNPDAADSIVHAIILMKLKEHPVHTEFLGRLLSEITAKSVVSLLKNTVHKANHGDLKTIAIFIPGFCSRFGEMSDSKVLAEFLLLLTGLIADKNEIVIKTIATHLPQLSEVITKRDLTSQVSSDFQSSLASSGGVNLIIKSVLCASECASTGHESIFDSLVQYLNIVLKYTNETDKQTLQLVSNTFDMFSVFVNSHRADHTRTQTPEEALHSIFDSASDSDKRILASTIFELTARCGLRDVSFQRVLWRVISELLFTYPDVKQLPFMSQFLTAASLNSPELSNRCRLFLTDFLQNLVEVAPVLEVAWYSSAFGPIEVAADADTCEKLYLASQSLFPRECIEATIPQLSSLSRSIARQSH